MYHMEKESYQNVKNCTSQMQHNISAYLCKCLVSMQTRCETPHFLLQILLRETVIEKLQYVES